VQEVRIVLSALCLMSAAAMASHATTLATWNSGFGFAGPAGLMPDDSLQLTLFVTALGSSCPGGSQCAMLFDPILSANSVGLVFTLDSATENFGQAVTLIEADATLLEYFPNGTGFGNSASHDFDIALPRPLFPGDTITDLELTIVSCSFQINNSFTGAGARIFGFDLTVNGTGPVPTAPAAEPASWLILGLGMACLLLFTSPLCTTRYVQRGYAESALISSICRAWRSPCRPSTRSHW